MRNIFATLGLATLLLVNSADAQVRILPRPSATVDGSSEMLIKRIPEGNEFLLTVNKGQDLSYYTIQWFKDGVAIPGEVSQELRHPFSSADYNGTYTVEMTSPCATVMSKPIQVIVNSRSFAVETRVGSPIVAGRLAETENSSVFTLKDAQPNPATDRTTIAFTSTETAPITIKVVDLNGQVIATLVNEVLGSGSHEVVLNTREYDMSNSMYYVIFSAPGHTETKPLIISR